MTREAEIREGARTLEWGVLYRCDAYDGRNGNVPRCPHCFAPSFPLFPLC